MTALNPNTTSRFWLDYGDGINAHTLLTRYKDSVNINDVMAALDALWLAIADSWYEVTIIGARFAEAGSDVSNPITWTGGATYGATAMPKVFAPRQFCLLGRDVGGHRMRMFLFGFEGSSPDDYRIPREAANIVDDALTVIEDQQGNGIFCSISGFTPAMYQYADFNFNNYYERKSRA